MRLRLVLIGVLAATLLAACGGGDDNDVARQTTPPQTTPSEDSSKAGLVAEAGEGTFAEGSSRVAFDATLTASGGDERSFSADGAFDFEEQVGRLSVSVGGGETELLYDEDVAYAQVPEGMLPFGKRWLKIDLKTLGDVSGVDLAQLAQAGQAMPAQYLRWLSAAKDVERVGEEDVRGVPTTHYRGVIDVERLIREQPALRPSLRALGLDEVPTEVWIDEDGLLRRLTQDYELGSAGEKAKTSVTMELYDFGVEVDVEPPDAEEVFDISDLIGGSS